MRRQNSSAEKGRCVMFILMNLQPVAVVLAVAISLTGCMSFVSDEDYRIQPEPYLAQSDPAQATVVFLWTDPKIKTVALPIYQDGVQVGALKSNTYARHLLPPGFHAFATALGGTEQDHQTVHLSVEAGKRYFLRFRTAAFWRPHSLELIGEDVALQYLVGLPRTQFINSTNSEPRPDRRGDAKTAAGS
jgi:hypothetical protein